MKLLSSVDFLLQGVYLMRCTSWHSFPYENFVFSQFSSSGSLSDEGVLHCTPFPMKRLSSVDFLLRGVSLIRCISGHSFPYKTFVFSQFSSSGSLSDQGVLHCTPFPMKLLPSVSFLLQGVYLMRVYFGALLSL